MSRFASLTQARKSHKDLTVNRAGGESYTLDARLSLVTLLASSFAMQQYYSSAGEQVERIGQLVETLVESGDARFAAKAALYSRNELGMRTTSHVLAAELARLVKGQRWTKHFYHKVARRPDDVCEILAYYIVTHGKPIPNSLKRGLGQALAGYDAYRLGKYRRANAEFSLVDAVNLCRPPHTPQLAALVNGTLEAPDTWEVGLTQAGGDEEAKSQVWAELLREGKLGYFALLRNLRNICQQAPEVLDLALEQLVDSERIRRSLVMPFRFYTAAQQLMADGVPNKVIAALATALEHSVANVPVFEGNTLVVIDRSGSMDSALGGSQHTQLAEAAALFGVTLAKRNPDGVEVMIFGNTAVYVPLNLNDSVVSLTEYVGKRLNFGGGYRGGATWDSVGHGTNFHAALELANKRYERIVYLSDMQGWVGYNAPTGTLRQYEQRHNAKPYIYSVDMAGYGTSMFPDERIFTLAGFSEKLFDVMAMLEQDKQALIDKIEAIEL
jgi:60 kDa SS-A/Ro ribonucleoprotein